MFRDYVDFISEFTANKLSSQAVIENKICNMLYKGKKLVIGLSGSKLHYSQYNKSWKTLFELLCMRLVVFF